MKLALVDLLFAYPSRGGAGVDLVETFRRLQPDVTVRLFVPAWDGAHPRGTLDAVPPLPVERVPIPAPLTRESVVEWLTAAIERWNPDRVFMSDGWTLKPFMALALEKTFPLILRFYAWEMLCPRNNERWLWDHKCSNSMLLDSPRCLACARDYHDIIASKRGPTGNPLTFEMDLARLWEVGYPSAVRAAVQKASTIVVYNQPLAAHLRDRLSTDARFPVPPIEVLPGGVDPAAFPWRAPVKTSGPLRILVFGRMDDPAKGAQTAIEAGIRLADDKFPFVMTVTRRPTLDHAWLRESGWQSRESVRELLADADVAVMPSLWDEAFGMTWVEALCAGVPTIVSATAGPLSYLTHDLQCLMFEPGDVSGLVNQIRTLADSFELRTRLSVAGRADVMARFTWDQAAERMKRILAQTGS